MSQINLKSLSANQAVSRLLEQSEAPNQQAVITIEAYPLAKPWFRDCSSTRPFYGRWYAHFLAATFKRFVRNHNAFSVNFSRAHSCFLSIIYDPHIETYQLESAPSCKMVGWLIDIQYGKSYTHEKPLVYRRAISYHATEEITKQWNMNRKAEDYKG